MLARTDKSTLQNGVPPCRMHLKKLMQVFRFAVRSRVVEIFHIHLVRKKFFRAQLGWISRWPPARPWLCDRE